MGKAQPIKCTVKVVELVRGEFPVMLVLRLPKPFMPGLDCCDSSAAVRYNQRYWHGPRRCDRQVADIW
jgi:hypothetical protein